MLVRDGRSVGRRPTVTPFGQRDNHRHEVEPLLRQVVGLMTCRFVGGGHQSGLDEVRESRRENVGRDVQALLKFTEPGHPGERRVSEDEQAPALAHDLERARWSLLILRNAAFAGMTRFSEFQKSLDIAPNILAARLAYFVETGLMTTSDEAAGHQTYHLTKQGLDFTPVIIALTEWGDRWAAPDGPPIAYEHEGCGGRVKQRLYCKSCGKSVPPQDVTARKTAVMGRLQERRKAQLARTT